ncbi:hypothetical protein [Endozoicomonas sp. ISHI1]|uniref:hypothetical protein n=2 Tax=unclassified Endozoicomonas TaxID=2644528 RepID=UPI002148904E|nr:hypothetical protein [Endozoicomonas sp. ISHI1]
MIYPCSVRAEYRDSIIKHSLFAALRLLLLMLSVVCQAEPLTERFIVDTKDTPLYSNPDSGISEKVVVALTVASLLKSYWNPDIPSFNSVELRGTSQDHPFTISAMMPGSGDNQQPNPPSESYGQKALPKPIGFFTSLLYSDSGGDNGVPEQHLHTLGLNCFVHPCHGACQFRQSSDSSDSRAPDYDQSLTDPTVATPGQSSCPHLANRYCSICNPVNGVASDGTAIDSMVAGTIDKNAPAGKVICSLIIFGEDGQQLQCGKVFKNAKSLSYHISKYHSGQKTCDLTLVGEDGQLQPCGTVCKNAQALLNHKRRDHVRQQTCDVTVIREDGQPRLCGKDCRNAEALYIHKIRRHTGQKICDVTVIGEDGQPKPCEKVCRNAAALSTHKSGQHTGKKTCDMAVIGEDGRLQPCVKVCKNAQTLSVHKIRDHTRQQTCDIPVIGGGGLQRPCGRVCRNAAALSTHKSGHHTGKKTCDVTVIGENGCLRPCGKIFKNANSLSAHKTGYHTGQQTCAVTVVQKDGQPQPCGQVFRNAQALSNHKRKHRRRKPSVVDHNDDLGP